MEVKNNSLFLVLFCFVFRRQAPRGRGHVSLQQLGKQAVSKILSVDKYKWTKNDLCLQLTARAGLAPSQNTSAPDPFTAREGHLAQVTLHTAVRSFPYGCKLIAHLLPYLIRIECLKTSLGVLVSIISKGYTF